LCSVDLSFPVPFVAALSLFVLFPFALCLFDPVCLFDLSSARLSCLCSVDLFYPSDPYCLCFDLSYPDPSDLCFDLSSGRLSYPDSCLCSAALAFSSLPVSSSPFRSCNEPVHCWARP